MATTTHTHTHFIPPSMDKIAATLRSAHNHHGNGGDTDPGRNRSTFGSVGGVPCVSDVQALASQQSDAFTQIGNNTTIKASCRMGGLFNVLLYEVIPGMLIRVLGLLGASLRPDAVGCSLWSLTGLFCMCHHSS